MKKTNLLPLATALFAACSQSLPTATDDAIRINQIGYYAKEAKTAVIEADAVADTYKLIDTQTTQTVWEGEASRVSTSPWSDKVHHIIDFSTVTQPGQYIIEAGPCHRTITIDAHPFHDLSIAALKAFYYQRSGEPIDATYAGQWARPAAHPDTCVMVHASAATKKRPEGTRLSSPGGWYDAGDYNKYIVNSAFTIGEILITYQFNTNYFKHLKLNIPESGNALPDILDEMLVNLKWMLTMQDEDGGVYHKLTTPNFEGFQMPAQCCQPRYVVYKSTAATLDFAATMALASRIYGEYDDQKAFARQALNAAVLAWKWAQRHPKAYYVQNELNEKYQPAIQTGEYGDGSLNDEFHWAATELYLTTHKNQYLYSATRYATKRYSRPTWGQVEGLAAMEWMVQTTYGFSPEAERLGNRYTTSVTAFCDSLLNTIPQSLYDAPYGNAPSDFGWGCLAEKGCGNGLSLLFAYRMTNERKYLEAAIKCADYLLGRNATGYCYVTGFGNKSPMYPHHRLSASDNIDAPIPGLLVGGPNPAQQDHAEGYISNHPDESYADVTASYASNEIAINWNAGLAAFIGWLDAELK
ncbi:MAG: glycoside hydrolase family 9 protein [Bacteroidales bacterium]|nr:glycoside hydrolase family 9 protein [Bacteroidales bacterium]